jgi:hypothetical protein
MDVFRYCRLVFWSAVRPSLDWAQAIIFLALALIGTVILVVPYFGMTLDASSLLKLIADPRLIAILLGSVVVTRLLCAPYWVWRDERKAVAAAASRGGMGMREIMALYEHASAIRGQSEEMRLQREMDESIDEDYPNLRVADCPDILEMFHVYDAKLTGLLLSGKLKSWARRMSGDSRLITFTAELWKIRRLEFYPKSAVSGSGGINQTFIRDFRQESTHYDLCLNVSQVRRIWPELSHLKANEMKL